MKQITHIKKNLYIGGEYTFRNMNETNWFNPIDCPTVFVAYGAGVRSGNWSALTAINTPDSLNKFYKEYVDESHASGNYTIPYPKLTESERYEFGGLTYAIAHLNEAWAVVNSGNHGTDNGTDITNPTTADAILEALKVPVTRANELLSKMRGED